MTRAAYIIITHHHTDHRAGAEALRSATGAQVLAHVLEKGLSRDDSTPIPADVWIEDEPVLDLGNLHLKLLHMPGHSPGHLCVLVPEREILFSGDQVLGVGTTAIDPVRGSMAQHVASLERLLTLNINVVLPAHGPPIRQPQRKLQELIEHRRAREQQVLALVGRGVATVDELLQEVYPELEPRLVDMARGQLGSHLVKLEQEGRIVAGDGRYRLP